MDTAKSKLTVFFDPPFWVGIFEREHAGRYEACKFTFGAEPREFEVYRLILEDYGQLEFSPALAAPEKAEPNPKRAQRLARRETRQTGAGTKAQQALQLQREQNKARRRLRSRQEREAEQERQYRLLQEKRKEKHRGR